MPPSPTWLRRVPNAIEKLEAWEYDSLTRADLQKVLGVGKARAVQLMREWGAERRGGGLLLEKGALLRRFKAMRRGRQLAEEEQRVERVIGVLQEARVSRVRVKVPRETLGARLTGLPAGVVLETDRRPCRWIVEFDTAEEGARKLFAIAQALQNDWDRFEELVAARRGTQ